MDFKLSKEQELIQKAAREYAEKVIEPLVDQIDRENKVPERIIYELGELELTGIAFPEEYGGAGAGYLSFILAMEQIAKVSSGVTTILTVSNFALSAINLFGTLEQKKQWMPPVTTGKQCASLAFTEPGTGSDPKALKTIAKKDGDFYIINGTKRFITSSDLHGPMVLVAKDAQSGKPTAFLIEKFCPGYSLSAPWEKIGTHGSHTYDVYLNDVRVPVANMLGGEGMGYKLLTQSVGYGKIGVCSLSLGGAQAALDTSIKYAKEKTHRDQPISRFQSMQMRLAKMAIDVEAARWLVYRLGYLADTMDDRNKLAKEAALTKAFTSEVFANVAREAVQVHGSYGVMKDYKVETLYRDSIIDEVVEGTKDLQRLIVAGDILS